MLNNIQLICEIRTTPVKTILFIIPDIINTIPYMVFQILVIATATYRSENRKESIKRYSFPLSYSATEKYMEESI